MHFFQKKIFLYNASHPFSFCTQAPWMPRNWLLILKAAAVAGGWCGGTTVWTRLQWCRHTCGAARRRCPACLALYPSRLWDAGQLLWVLGDRWDQWADQSIWIPRKRILSPRYKIFSLTMVSSSCYLFRWLPRPDRWARQWTPWWSRMWQRKSWGVTAWVIKFRTPSGSEIFVPPSSAKYWWSYMSRLLGIWWQVTVVSFYPLHMGLPMEVAWLGSSPAGLTSILVSKVRSILDNVKKLVIKWI